MASNAIFSLHHIFAQVLVSPTIKVGETRQPDRQTAFQKQL